MTNKERWDAYTSGLPCPDNYLEWGWYFTVSASLQRRVWMPPSHQKCFSNLYVILVGPPGVGKGLTIKAVSSILKHWTLDVFKANEKVTADPVNAATVEMSIASNLKAAKEIEFQGNHKGPKDIIKPLLIPVCADAITYEALVMAVAGTYRYINYLDPPNAVSDKPTLKSYGHSSECFLLEELGSLLRKKSNDTVTYLLGLYDCPDDYEYTTVSRGKERVRRGCLNILAGTTPSFMSATFDDTLIGEGFTSRTNFIYAARNRKNVWTLPQLTKEQEQYRDELREHVKRLTTMYGEAKVSPTTEKWLEEWWDNYNRTDGFQNKAQELIPYYARKNINIKKLTMCRWFGEHADVDSYGRPKDEIPLEAFQETIAFLEKEEKNMHLALRLEGNSKHCKATQKIIDMLQSGKKNFVDLYIACQKHIDSRADLEEALSFLVETRQIDTKVEADPITNKEITYYVKM